MALDFIGVGECDGEERDGLLLRKDWLGDNPAPAIGAIVRAMVPCALWLLLARWGICGNNQLLQ